MKSSKFDVRVESWDAKIPDYRPDYILTVSVEIFEDQRVEVRGSVARVLKSQDWDVEDSISDASRVEAKFENGAIINFCGLRMDIFGWELKSAHFRSTTDAKIVSVSKVSGEMNYEVYD